MADRDTLVSIAGNGQATPVGDIRPGTLLRDTYRVLSHVSTGGVGTVFVAAHERLPGRVAIKALQGDRLLDPESLARFRAEAEVTASLRHPNIVQILDFDVSPGGVPYLVMEFLDGADLRTVGAQGPLSVERVARVVRQIAAALQAAHAAGVIHRDLKPENVMLIEIPGETDFVKVVDFGLSKLMHHTGPPVTRPDQILGTPGYMPPEQIRGRPLDARADQFALASLSYELFSGKSAFRNIDTRTWLTEILHEEPPPLSEMVSWPAVALAGVLARGMAKNPNDRYASVAEFDQAVRAAIDLDRQAQVDPVATGAATPAKGEEPSPADTAELHEIGKSFRW